MSKGSLITLAVLVVLVLGGALGFKAYKRDQLNAEARASAESLLKHNVVVQQHKDYVYPLIERFHEQAFAKAYTSGGLTGGAEYDEAAYIDELWTLIKAQAQADAKYELIPALPATGSGVH